MATQSIIQIKIDDSDFARHQARLDKYKEQIAKIPSQWGAVGKTFGTINTAVDKFLAHVADANNKFKQADSFAGKLNLTLKSSDRTVTALVRGTGAMARNIKDATISLLKWGSLTSLISGVLGGGGLFGISALASGVKTDRQRSLETGTSFGQNKAANTVYGHLIDVQSTLTKIAQAKENFGMNQQGKPVFQPMGITDWDKKDNITIMQEILAKAKQFMTENKGRSELMAPAFGFDEFTSFGQRNAIGAAGTNLETLKTDYQSAAKADSLGEKTQTAWSRFSTLLDAAKDKIEMVFVRGLTPLIKPLGDFSSAVGNALATILGSPQTKKWIEGAGKGIEDFAKYLTKPEFKEDVASFLDALDKMAGALYSTGKWLGDKFGSGLGLRDQNAIKNMQVVKGVGSEEFWRGYANIASGSNIQAGEFSLNRLLTTMDKKLATQMADLVNPRTQYQSKELAERMAAATSAKDTVKQNSQGAWTVVNVNIDGVVSKGQDRNTIGANNAAEAR